ncbi:MAG: PAS domain S-box protein [Bacteroidales bacterium]|nr:PAS domain S-box protein [Bacteroidales bacterium]
MNHPIKILILEDNPSDAKLIQYELKAAGLNFISKQINNQLDFINQLDSFMPDVILSDYNLPQFTGMEALEIAAKKQSETPFIIVTGSLDEETAVDCMKQGAWDYVIKENLIRLVPAIHNALKLREEKLKTKKAYELLAKSEAKYFDLYNNAPDMFLSINIKNSKIVDCNQTLLNELGYTRKELIGKSVFDLYAPKTIKRINDEQDTDFYKSNERKDIEIKKKNGEILIVSSNTSFIRDNNGKILYTRSIWHDVTKQRKIEKELARNEELLNEAQKIANFGSWDYDLIHDKLRWSDEIYRIFNLDKHKTEPSIDLFKRHIHTYDFDRVTKALSDAINKRKPYNIEYRLVDGKGAIRCVHAKGQLETDKHGKPIRLFGVIQDITDRKKIEQELIRTAEIINMSSSVVFLWKNVRNWPIKHVSPNVSKILGYTDKEFLSNTVRFMDIIHPDDSKRVLNELNRARKNLKINKFEHKPYRIITKTGEIVWVEDQTEIIRDVNGKIIFYQGVIHDITDEILANQKLQEQKNKYEALSKKYHAQNQKLKSALSAVEQSEQKYRSILNANTDAVIITSEDCHVQYMNPAAKNKFGTVEKTEICHKALFKQEKKCEWCGFHNLNKPENSYEEIKHPIDDRIYIVSNSRILNNDGSSSLMSVYRDVTELRKAERERLKFLDTLEASLNEIFIFDVKSLKFHYVNQGGIKHLGYSLEEFKNMTPLAIAPEFDKESLNKLLAPLEKGKQKKIIFETTHKRKDGSLYPIEVHLQLISQNSEKFYLAVINDITERVKNEETIRKLSAAISQSPLSVIITDTDGKIEFVNPKFTETTGYSFDEVIGKNPNILKSGHHTKAFFNDLWKTITNGDVWRGEFLNKKKSNTLYWDKAVIGPVKNEKGEIINFIGLQQDITEQKQLSEKLKIKTEQIERIFNNVQDVIYSIEIAKERVNNKVIQISPSCKDVLGYEQKEFYKNPSLITDIIYPDDKKFALIPKQKFVKNKILNLKYRIINSKGEIKWINNKITPRFNQEGELVRLDASMSDITNSQLLQNSLKQALDFNDRIISTSGLGVLMFNNEGICISVNENAAKIAGYSVEELLKQKYSEIPLYKEAGLVDDAKKCLKTETEIKKIVKLKNKHKKHLWLDIHFSTYFVDDKIRLLILIKDISKIKFAEREVQQKALELRNLIQTVNTPIFGLDMNGRINEWNRAAQKLTGYTKTEVLNKEFATTLFAGNEKKVVRGLIVESVLGFKVPDSELQIQAKDGKVIKMMMNISTYRNIEGKVIGVICAGQDITKMVDYRLKLEKKVKKRTRKLKKALEKEKELNLLKSKFVSMASHEFRTPLAAINFAAGFVKKYWQKMDDDSRLKKLSKIEEQVKHMTSLLNDVLTIGKIDAGQIKFNPQIIDFKEFMDAILEEVQNVTNYSHEIRIKNVCKLNKIYIDEKLGRNIFINLLSNAIKFSPDKNFIELKCSSNKEFLNFEIKDYGIGIKKEDLEHIFEPFRRGTNTDTIQGTGLGLAIVKESVEKHKGSIHVDSELGRGTTFTVNLPIVPDEKLSSASAISA